VIGNKAGHLVHQPGAFAKSFLESIGIFLLDVNTICDSYHCDSLPLSNDTRCRDRWLVSRGKSGCKPTFPTMS